MLVAGDLTDRSSTSGYCSYVWGNLVTWRSKRQSIVARFSAKDKYRALILEISKGMWIQKFLNELRIKLKIQSNYFATVKQQAT